MVVFLWGYSFFSIQQQQQLSHLSQVLGVRLHEPKEFYAYVKNFKDEHVAVHPSLLFTSVTSPLFMSGSFCVFFFPLRELHCDVSLHLVSALCIPLVGNGFFLYI